MKITCGTDIIEISRIKESIENLGNKFLERVYTKKEIQYCESKKSQKYQHYAARFAAKEAVFKAVSTKLDNKYDIVWKNIEIVNDETGRPHADLIELNIEEIEEIEEIDVSVSHCKEYAVANVVVAWR